MDYTSKSQWDKFQQGTKKGESDRWERLKDLFGLGNKKDEEDEDEEEKKRRLEEELKKKAQEKGNRSPYY